MRVAWVLVLGLACAVNARDCLTSVAMDNINLQKIEGRWYEIGYAPVNETEAAEFDNLNCIDVYYKAHENYLEVGVKNLESGSPNDETGKYTPKNNSNATYSIYYPERPLYSKYTFNFVCTDYKNYAVTYSSLQYEPGHCSEFPTIKVRDISKYEDLKNNSEMKRCIQEKLGITVDKFKTIKHDACQ